MLCYLKRWDTTHTMPWIFVLSNTIRFSKNNTEFKLYRLSLRIVKSNRVVLNGKLIIRLLGKKLFLKIVLFVIGKTLLSPWNLSIMTRKLRLSWKTYSEKLLMIFTAQPECCSHKGNHRFYREKREVFRQTLLVKTRQSDPNRKKSVFWWLIGVNKLSHTI